jgi:hypothetical protein
VIKDPLKQIQDQVALGVDEVRVLDLLSQHGQGALDILGVPVAPGKCPIPFSSRTISVSSPCSMSLVSNADWFGIDALLHVPPDWELMPADQQKLMGQRWQWGYPTFYNAYAYQHHVNKDPARAFGTVEYVLWDSRMKRVLLIDEVDDSRSTLAYCLRELLRHSPAEVAVAVLHNKRKPKRENLPLEVRRYFCGQEVDDGWICYPWDAEDIERHEAMA